MEIQSSRIMEVQEFHNCTYVAQCMNTFLSYWDVAEFFDFSMTYSSSRHFREKYLYNSNLCSKLCPWMCQAALQIYDDLIENDALL